MDIPVHIRRGAREIADTIRDDFYDQDVIGLSIMEASNPGTEEYLVLASEKLVSVILINTDPRYSEDLLFLLNSSLPKKIVFDSAFVITSLKSRYPGVRCRSIVDVGNMSIEYHREELYNSVITSLEKEVDAIATGEKTELDYAVTMATRALSTYLEMTSAQSAETAPELTSTRGQLPTPKLVSPDPVCFFSVLNELNHELRKANGQVKRQDLIRRFAGRTKHACSFEQALDFIVNHQYLHQRDDFIFLI